MTSMTMLRGDVVLVHVPFSGTTSGKVRPAVVVQNDRLNQLLRETVILEVTSNVRNLHQPNQVLVEQSTPGCGLLMDSVVCCERIHTIPQADIQRVIGCLPEAVMQQIAGALKFSLGYQ